MLSQTTGGDDGGDRKEWKVSGFGFWTEEIPKDSDAHLKLSHLWLIGDKTFDDKLEVKIILAFTGPPKIVHTLSAKWKNPIDGVKHVRVGKFEPPFGWEFRHYRIDRLPTIFYSAIDDPLVARSNGIEIAGAVKRLEWVAGIFSGERIRGNIDPSDDGKWDIYQRLRYTFSEVLGVGVSQRLGPVHAWGIDLVSKFDPFRLEMESVSSLGRTNYSVLSVYSALPEFGIVLRYENVESKNRWTPGFSIKLPHDWEIKGNAVINRAGLETIIGQFIVRW